MLFYLILILCLGSIFLLVGAIHLLITIRKEYRFQQNLRREDQVREANRKRREVDEELKRREDTKK